MQLYLQLMSITLNILGAINPGARTMFDLLTSRLRFDPMHSVSDL